ncbi:MAG: hypothetical protein R2788_18365 [Saprospiraceae bacterium]
MSAKFAMLAGWSPRADSLVAADFPSIGNVIAIYFNIKTSINGSIVDTSTDGKGACLIGQWVGITVKEASAPVHWGLGESLPTEKVS